MNFRSAAAFIAGMVIAAAGSSLDHRGDHSGSRTPARSTRPRRPPAQAEFENESMLVLRVRMAPHAKTGMHDVSARLVVWLTDAHIRDAKLDGATSDYRRGAGTVEWIETQRHAGENLSDAPIEFLAVIAKSATPGARGDRKPH